MPKRKPDSESEEEDVYQSEEASGSDNPSTSKQKTKAMKKDRLLTVKKPKVDEGTGTDGATPHIRTNAEGDKYIDLGKKRRAVLRSFKGMALLDIREYYGADGEEKPGRKGISLQLEQWQALRDASSTIDELFRALKK